MDLREILRVIAHYRRTIIIICLSAVATATGMSFALAEHYRSVAQVLIRPQKSLDTVPQREEMLSFPVSYFTPVEATTKTYTEIIKSRMIADRIVKSIGAESMGPAPFGTGWRAYLARAKTGVKNFFGKGFILLMYGRVIHEDPYSSAVTIVQKSLTVKPTKETFLFEIQAEMKSASLAAIIANTAARVFIDYLREISDQERENARRSEMEKIHQASQEFNRRQLELIEYKEKAGVISPRKEAELQLETLSSLESLRTDLHKRLKGAEAKLLEITRQLSECNKFSRSEIKQAENPLYQDLKQQLARKEVELAGLLLKFTREHGDVKSLIAEISEIKARMDQECPTIQIEETLAVDSTYRSVTIEQLKAKAELEALKAEEVKLESSIQEKKALILQLPRKASELVRLETLVEVSQESYKLLAKHVEETELSSNREAPILAVVQQGTVPLFPVRPIKLFHALLAGILSLLTGVGLAFTAELLNPCLSSAKDAEQVFARPVIGVVPTLGRLNQRGAQAALEWLHSYGKESSGINFSAPGALLNRLNAESRRLIWDLNSEIQLYHRRGQSTFLVTSCSAGEGKSTIAAILAASLADLKKKVLLIDANLAAPAVHQFFGLARAPGLAEMLTDLSASPQLPPNDPVKGEGLRVLTAGAERLAQLLDRDRLVKLLGHYKERYDYVLLDGTTLLAGPEAVLAASIADVTLVVIDTDATSKEMAARAGKVLERIQATNVGLIMNHWNHGSSRC